MKKIFISFLATIAVIGAWFSAQGIVAGSQQPQEVTWRTTGLVIGTTLPNLVVNVTTDGNPNSPAYFSQINEITPTLEMFTVDPMSVPYVARHSIMNGKIISFNVISMNAQGIPLPAPVPPSVVLMTVTVRGYR